MAHKLQLVSRSLLLISARSKADDGTPSLPQLVDEANGGGANPHLKDKLKVVKGKIEDYTGPQVDTLVSEPIGVLLVHERMIESYIHARDRFLKPGGCESHQIWA